MSSAEIIILIVIVIVGFFTHLFASKTRLSNTKVKIITSVVVLSLSASGYYVDRWGIERYGETIGSSFEKQSYKSSHYYYVYVRTSTGEYKRYHLKASVIRLAGIYELGAVEWPNGGYLSFEEYSSEIPLAIGKQVLIPDDKGKSWWIELTTEKAE